MTKTQPFLISRTALAGVLAGLAGFGAFLLIHQALIVPIWFIAPLGSVVAALAGLLVAWAFEALRPRLPQNTWLAVLAFVALLTLTQLAAFFASSMQEPIANMVFRNQALPGRLGTILTRFAIDLFLTSAIIGGLAGYLVGRASRRPGAWRWRRWVLPSALGTICPSLLRFPVAWVRCGR